ncbi:MAG: MFS transporter [Clostridia bacterium]|nr:MFS transporter [Clostridia bacterium]MBR5265205.1 MFS transporter [Clostridia bacterium]
MERKPGRLRETGKSQNIAAMVVLEGALWALVVQFTQPFYQLFVRQMGGDDLAISLVSSLPALFALVTLMPFSAYIDTVPRKKPLVGRMIALYAVLLPLMAATPFMGAIKVPAFILLIALFNIPLLAYTVGWQSFFADILDERERVMPHARREMMKNYIQGIVSVAGGFVLSYICVTNAQKITTYQLLFMIAFVFAVLQARVLKKTDDSHVADKPKKKMMSFAEIIRMAASELKKNKSYSLFLGMLFIFYIAANMGSSLFFLYVVNVVGANEFLKNTLDFVGVMLFGVTATFWGKIIQKKGSRFTSVIGYYACAASPILLVVWNTTLGLWINYVISGLFSPPLHLGMFNDMLELVPEENRTFNIGIYNTMLQIATFIGPLLGVMVYRASTIEFALILSGVLRAVGGLLFHVRYVKTKG